MTILVTGGAGFIGSNFIFYWLDKHPGDRVVCLDKLTYAGSLSTLKSVMDRPDFRFVKGDICDKGLVLGLFREERPEYVINFAAESHVDRSITGPEVFLQSNYMGTAVLLEACRECGVGRYHQVSTDEVYGDLPLDRPDLFLPRTRRCTPVRRIARPRLRLTCWYSRMCVPTRRLLPFHAARIITGPASSRKSLSR